MSPQDLGGTSDVQLNFEIGVDMQGKAFKITDWLDDHLIGAPKLKWRCTHICATG